MNQASDGPCWDRSLTRTWKDIRVTALFRFPVEWIITQYLHRESEAEQMGDRVNVYLRIFLIAVAPNTSGKGKPPSSSFQPKVSLAPLRQTSPPPSCFAHQPAFLCLWRWLLTVWTQQGGPARWYCKCQQSSLTGLFYWCYTTATCGAAVALSVS